MEEEDAEDSRQSGIAWCFAAILAFMAMLLIRHIFELFDGDMSMDPAAQPHHEPDHSHDPFGMDGSPSAGMLVMWLIVRFLVILIPMYAVLRVMHTIRDQQIQQDVDRELEQEMMNLLWVSPTCVPCISRLLVTVLSGGRVSLHPDLCHSQTRGMTNYPNCTSITSNA